MNNGYIHVEPVLGNYVHGDGLLGTVPLQPDGQWDAFLPETHQQDENGFEPEDCVSEATINCVETLEKQEYGSNSGWARRYLAKNSGTDVRGGNDPQTVSECLRTQGCVAEADYTFKAATLSEFYQSLAQYLKTLAIGSFARFVYGHSWVNADPQSMMDALAYSPLSAAGFAWSTLDANGHYTTPSGTLPCHDFEVYGFVANNYWKVRDSYAPFNKKLAWDYQFTGAKRHTLHRQAGNTPVQQTAWQNFVNLLRKILGLDPIIGGVPRSSQWSGVRNEFIKNNPTCAACGTNKKLQAHHVVAYHTDKAKELDPSNLIALCEGMERNCHRFIGHLDNFQSINENSREDAAAWLKRVQNRPKWNGQEWVYPTV